MPLTREQFNELRKKGLSVEQIVAFEQGKKPGSLAPQQDGFLASVVKDPIKTLLIKPAVRTGQAIGALGVSAFGSEEQKRRLGEEIGKDVTLDAGILGKYTIEGQKGFGDGGAKQIVGDAAKSASYLASGGTAANAAGSLFKGRILKATAGGAAAGATGGSLYGFGDSIQQDDSTVGSVTYDTLFGAASGAAVGGVLGGGGAVASKITRGTANTVRKGAEIVTNESKRSEAIYNAVTERNRKILNITQKQSQLEGRGGRDTATFLAKEIPDAPFKLDNNGRLDTNDVIDQLSTKYAAEEHAFEAILESERKFVSLDEWERSAISRAKKEFKGSSQEDVITKIRREASAYRNQYGEAGYLNQKGEVVVALDRLNEIKRDLWSKTNFSKEESALFRDANFLMGNTAKDMIENMVTDIKVKDFNRRLGDFAQAMKILKQRNGAAVRGGRLGQHFARLTGALVGSAGGGLPGAVAGGVTGSKLAEIMMNPEYSTAVIRQLIKTIPKNQRQQIVEEAERILLQREATFRKIPLLPESKTIFAGPGSFGTSGPVKPRPLTPQEEIASQKVTGTYKVPTPQE